MSITVTICLMALILALFFIVLEKKEFSETENRNLTDYKGFSFQRLLNGEFIKNIESYMVDHFPLREEFIGFRTSVLKILGQNKINNVYIGKNNFLLEEYSFTSKNTNIPIDTLNKFNKNIPSNVNMSLMLVPTSVDIYKKNLPRYSTNTSQKDVIEYVYENIDFNSINAYEYLENAPQAIDLYYKTDHHWTTFGAYLGFVAYMINKGDLEFETPQFEKVSDDFYGTLYSKVIDNSLKTDKIYKLTDDGTSYTVKNIATNSITNTLYQEEWLFKKDKYSYFLGENQPLLEIENKTIENNKKILIIKDSYANAMIPFLAREYKYVYVMDPRLYRMAASDYIKEKQIEEVLLVYNVQTVETDLGIRSLR